MTAFPALDTIHFATPFSEQITFKTQISHYGNEASEQRKQSWLFPKRNITVSYKNISITEARTLWQFYLNRKGSYEAFNLFLTRSETYTYEYVGTGDGDTLVYNLPCMGSSARTVYLNSIAQEVTTDYTYSALGGIDGADQITFVSAPETGYYITLSFTGYLKVRSRFMHDNLDFDTFYGILSEMGMELKGLLNQ